MENCLCSEEVQRLRNLTLIVKSDHASPLVSYLRAVHLNIYGDRTPAKVTRWKDKISRVFTDHNSACDFYKKGVLTLRKKNQSYNLDCRDYWKGNKRRQRK